MGDFRTAVANAWMSGSNTKGRSSSPTSLKRVLCICACGDLTGHVPSAAEVLCVHTYISLVFIPLAPEIKKASSLGLKPAGGDWLCCLLLWLQPYIQHSLVNLDEVEEHGVVGELNHNCTYSSALLLCRQAVIDRIRASGPGLRPSGGVLLRLLRKYLWPGTDGGLF
jgi:hypothetical protein